jgi:hypothetical protein
MSCGRHNESGRGEEEVAAMTAAEMSSRGRRAADEAKDQMAGQWTMQQESNDNG